MSNLMNLYVGPQVCSVYLKFIALYLKQNQHFYKVSLFWICLNFIIFFWPAISSFSPDTNVLILIGQMLTSCKVKSLNCLRIRTIKVLSAAVRSQIWMVTTVLGNLHVVVYLNVLDLSSLFHTFMLHCLFTAPAPLTLVWPSWKVRSLQQSEESTYTIWWKRNGNLEYIWYSYKNKHTLITVRYVLA